MVLEVLRFFDVKAYRASTFEEGDDEKPLGQEVCMSKNTKGVDDKKEETETHVLAD